MQPSTGCVQQWVKHVMHWLCILNTISWLKIDTFDFLHWTSLNLKHWTFTSTELTIAPLGFFVKTLSDQKLGADEHFLQGYCWCITHSFNDIFKRCKMTLPESPVGLLDPSSMHQTRTDLDEEESRHRWDINDNTMPIVSICCTHSNYSPMSVGTGVGGCTVCTVLNVGQVWISVGLQKGWTVST